MSKPRHKLTVTMDVTAAQALALQAFFGYWNVLAQLGGSQNVAFFVDGDGDFKPNCRIDVVPAVTLLTPRLERLAVASDNLGERIYDYDAIAAELDDNLHRKGVL